MAEVSYLSSSLDVEKYFVVCSVGISGQMFAAHSDPSVEADVQPPLTLGRVETEETFVLENLVPGSGGLHSVKVALNDFHCFSEN